MYHLFSNGASCTFTCTCCIHISGNILVPLQVATWAKKQKNAEQIPVQSPFCIKLAPRKCFVTEYVLGGGGVEPLSKELSVNECCVFSGTEQKWT